MSFLSFNAVVGLLLTLSACSNTTSETTGSTDEPDAFIQDVNTDAVTIGVDAEGAIVDATNPTLCDGVGEDQRVASPWIPASGDFVLQDAETGSLWNVRGEAFSGPCAGVRLSQIPAFNAFYFSWSATRSGAEVWNQDALNLPGDIQADESGDCNVPCDQIISGGPPPDGIPALDHLGRWDRPQAQEMIAASDATYLSDFDLVIGVVVDGAARAYPLNILNWHEIQIDQIGDVEFNLTYCPLTASALAVPADQGGEDPVYLFVSGRLYNGNLTMWERDVDDPTFWNQMLRRGIRGPRAGDELQLLPIVETTWTRWREMYPDTLVTSRDTGYETSSRSYDVNPYTDFQTDNDRYFGTIIPTPETLYESKSRVLALDGQDISRGYAFEELQAFGDRVVVNDVFEDTPIVVLFEAEHQMAIPFERLAGDAELTFSGASAP